MDILKRYFYGQLPPSEEQKVRQWLVEHGDEQEVIDELDRIMAGLAATDKELSSSAFKAVSARLGLHRSRAGVVARKVLKWAAYAAALILFPVLGAIGHDYMCDETEWVELSVVNGRTEELCLSDGTRLYLNSGSRVTYPVEFTGSQRRIFVEGEIFAEVAKDPEHPFVVSSGDVNVKVLGTTFNLKSYSEADYVELLLLEGAVQMGISSDDCSREIMVEPGEAIQYDRINDEIDIRRFSPDQYQGFHQNGAIHFFNLRFGDIVKDLERYFGVEIILLDQDLADTRYFAWFTNNETLDQILASINADGKMDFCRRGENIYITRK